MIEHKNARIESTMLGYEDHGIMTFVLNLDYGGTGQGAGCICMDDHKRPGPVTGAMISRILEVVGVMTWEELPGKSIRAKAEHCKVHAIGHYLKDEWINFSEFAVQIAKDAEDGMINSKRKEM